MGRPSNGAAKRPRRRHSNLRIAILKAAGYRDQAQSARDFVEPIKLVS